MITPKSVDPDVEQAAKDAALIIADTLQDLPQAETFDYGGHTLKLGDYGMCTSCTGPIAEAQAAESALQSKAGSIEDFTVREHLDLAIRLLHIDAEAAIIRAELHNGHGTEQILNLLLGFAYDRHIMDDYSHSHHGGKP